jgi:c(7)-type cytochrome triheme protein
VKQSCSGFLLHLAIAIPLVFWFLPAQSQTPADSERMVTTQRQGEELIPNPAPLTPLAEDGIHDPNNPAITKLQLPAESMSDFPKDRRGEVDWVQALRQGFINPRKSRDGDPYGGSEVMQTMDLDIVMKNTQQMPYVRFPHLAHTEWLACSNCHPAIFIPQEHANPISMEKVLKGEYCGRCHDKVSFSLFNCERCHSVPHEGSGPAWWK